jgi:hypothetical protein
VKARQIDDKQEFLRAFEARTRQLTDRAHNSTLPKSHVAFEVIAMALSGYEGDIKAQEIIEALPVQSWRDDTLILPRTLIATLVEGWQRYRKAPSGSTLGECFDLEGGGQGLRPARHKSDKIDQDVHLANAVCLELALAEHSGTKLSQSKAYRMVAERQQEAGPEVNEQTIKRAYKKYGEQMMPTLRKQLKDKTSSRS